MQTNSIRHLMDITLEILLFFGFAASIATNIFCLLSIQNLNKILSSYDKKLDKAMTESNKPAPEQPSSSIPPTKPNNWDSMKQAFKGPVRVQINERN
jgi:hypothetical protein